MPQIRLNVTIEQKGQLLNAAESQAAGARLVVRVNEALAQEGVNRVHQRLRQVLRNPTGQYQSMIAVERRQTYRGVWDQNSVKGGWLEGVTSRNRTTRFKGYRTFRMVKQSLDRDKAAIAQPIVDQFIQEMNR